MAAALATTANKTEETIVCYAPTMITTNGIWQGDNPLDYSLPLFILQLTMVVVITRFLVFVLKPFRQPRVIAEILVPNPFFCHLCFSSHLPNSFFTNYTQVEERVKI